VLPPGDELPEVEPLCCLAALADESWAYLAWGRRVGDERSLRIARGERVRPCRLEAGD
jgi:hypothetical protein